MLRPDPFLAKFEIIRRIRLEKPWIGYAAAVAGVALATLVRQMLPGISAPFITFYPVVIAAALVGGWRPGALAAVLSALSADYFFIRPIGSFLLAPLDVWALTTFAVVEATLVAIVALLNEAVDRLAQQAKNVRFVLDKEPAGVILVDAEGLISYVNRTAEKLFGYEMKELEGRPIEMLVPDGVQAAHVNLRNEFLGHPVSRPMGGGRDLHGRRRDGALVPIEVGLDVVERENKMGAMATVIDVSERKAAERRQQILLNELRHRGRNLLTMVQAIASQTIPLEARREFSNAIQSLARTHALFLETGTAPLNKIVE